MGIPIKSKTTCCLWLLPTYLMICSLLTSNSPTLAQKPFPSDFRQSTGSNTAQGEPNHVNQYALIDRTGKTRVKLPFQQVIDFHEGLAVFEQNHRFGIIDNAGHVVIAPVFASIDNFSCGLACVSINSNGNNELVYIDKAGKTVISDISELGDTFDKGYARVMRNSKLLLIDTSGNEIKKITPNRIQSDSMLRHGTRLKFEEQIIVIKDKQYLVLKLPHNAVPNSNYSEGLCSVNYGPENQFHDYVDDNGKFVTHGRFKEASDFKDGLAIVRVASNKLGYIDKTGRFVFAPIYEEAHEFSEGVAAVRVGRRSFFINKQGRTAIKPGYYLPGDFSEGLAPVNKYGKYGYLDKTGKIIIEPQYLEVCPFKNGVALVTY